MTPLRRVGPLAVALVGGALGAVLLRAYVLTSPLGALDSDEAVWGLMARRVLDGEPAVFFWAQSYGGTQETFLTALVFAVAGSSSWSLRAVPLLLFAVAALLVWRVGRRTIGEPGARVAAVLFAVWPAYLVWKSTRAHGFYAAALVLGLAVVLLAVRLRERDSTLDHALLGAALGLGWWATPQIAFLAVPALAWLVLRRPAALRGAWIALPAAVLSALPWLLWNLEHGWGSFDPGPEPGGDTYADRLVVFFASGLPAALGIRVPSSLDWLGGSELAGRALVAALVVGMAAAAVRRRAAEPLVACAVVYPFLFALSPFAGMVDEPRYLVLLMPVLALLAGNGLGPRPALAAAALAAAVLVSAAALVRMEAQGLAAPRAGGAAVPADLGPALRLLRGEGQNRVFAHYWIAYRISFETDEEILATSSGVVRDERAHRLVAADPRPARVFVAGSRDERASEPGLEAAGYDRREAGGFAVYVHEKG